MSDLSTNECAILMLALGYEGLFLRLPPAAPLDFTTLRLPASGRTERVRKSRLGVDQGVPPTDGKGPPASAT